MLASIDLAIAADQRGRFLLHLGQEQAKRHEPEHPTPEATGAAGAQFKKVVRVNYACALTCAG